MLPHSIMANTVRDHRTSSTNIDNQKTAKTQIVRDQRSTNRNNATNNKKSKLVQKELAFKIPKDMQKKTPTIQWTFKADRKGLPILSGSKYLLVNLVNDRALKKEGRIRGVADLGFKSSSKKANMIIKRQKGNGQIRYGDTVALKLNKYGWLKYKKQPRGINLSDDNNNPHYIWKIRGGQKGTKLVAGMPFALYNMHSKLKYEMIHCPRNYGVDIGWYPVSKCNTFTSKLSGKIFGDNGLLSTSDGYSGKVLNKMKDYICETAVTAAGAGITSATSGSAAPVVVIALPLAIEECKRF